MDFGALFGGNLANAITSAALDTVSDVTKSKYELEVEGKIPSENEESGNDWWDSPGEFFTDYGNSFNPFGVSIDGFA